MLRGASFLVLIVAFALPAGASAATSSPASVTRETSLETLVLRQVNEVRADHGLAPLSASAPLTRAALGHSRSMITLGFFTHESQNGTPFWQRVKRFYSPRSSGGWTVGENLAMFGGSAPNAESIVAAWMASSGHRANLLRRMFRDAGVAIVHGSSAGGVFGGESTWVITLDFGNR